MQNVRKAFLILTSALGACGSNGDQQDNRSNAIEVNSSVVEVETLPADESSATPGDELVNGVAEPVGNSGGY